MSGAKPHGPRPGLDAATSRREPVIAIDGPAGAGKGTVARKLAARLGYRLLDTGAMYRALAWSIARAGLAPDDTPALRRHVERVQIDLEGDRVIVDERDVTDETSSRRSSGGWPRRAGWCWRGATPARSSAPMPR